MIRAFSARQSAPRLFIAHADVIVARHLMNSGAIEELGDYLAGHVASLCKAGAQFVAIGAIAPHIAAPHIRQIVKVPLLDLIDCIRTELAARQVKRIAILGARFVMESRMHGRLDSWDVVDLPQEAIDFVDRNYSRIAAAGGIDGSGADVDGLRTLARHAVRECGADIVVLAGTDLSLAFDEASCGFPALDCVRLHVDAIVTEA
ncbi:MAG: aspartate/glutamate racemase family protein, partial [Steroidobacteraceae bacterium]